MTLVSAEVFEKSLIPAKDFVSCNQAFIDCKTPGSDKKENYAMIGPGVSQSEEQFINLREPHGFNIGAAAMPQGCVNNLHIHFTAEVFYLHKGDWEFRWGNAGEHTLPLSQGDLFSPRTWLFRGFRNIGVDDGFLFTVLGGDDTGGIIWHPDVLEKAKAHGLVLTADNKVIDTHKDPEAAQGVELITPLSAEQLTTLRQPSPEQMLKQVVRFGDLDWCDTALLSAQTAGGKCAMAPVIGWGMTEYRDHTPKIYNPHGFSVEWLKIPAGNSVKIHRIQEHQVLKMHQGELQVICNLPTEEQVSGTLHKKDIISVPCGAWREFKNTGSDEVILLVINGSDSPNTIEWEESVLKEALQNGYKQDKSHYIALKALTEFSKPML